MGVTAGIIVTAAIIAVIAIVFILARTRTGQSIGIAHLSHLKCGKCGTEFDYAWIPGASLTSIRLGGSRYFRCPSCRKFSLFNICNTQVDPKAHHCSIRIGPS